ncbi:MAG: rod shape-determining protein MreD [Bacteroidales bacterium]
MIKVLPRNLFRIIILVVFQIFILNNIQFSGFVNPYFYVLFILLLPFETPGWLLLSLAFVLGITIDLFSNTPGLHASATVFMAFLRPLVLNSFAPRDGYVPGTFPRIYYYGFGWFFQYSAILILGHHFFLFYMEVFQLSDFLLTFKRVVFSSIFTLFLVLISQFFIFRK